MVKCHKKPEEYDAWQWAPGCGSGSESKDAPEWVNEVIDFWAYDRDNHAGFRQSGSGENLHTTVAVITSFHNRLILRPGDWLVRSPSNAFTVYNNGAFEKMFEIHE